MENLSLPPASLHLLLAEAAARDLVTARRFHLFGILYHERYLTRAQLITRVEAHLGRGCFGAAAWKDTFYRDMRLVRQAFAAAGHSLRYSRAPRRTGYYLKGEPPLSAELESQIENVLAEIDPRQIEIWRQLSAERRFRLICSVSDTLRQVTAHHIRERNPGLSMSEAYQQAAQRANRPENIQ